MAVHTSISRFTCFALLSLILLACNDSVSNDSAPTNSAANAAKTTATSNQASIKHTTAKPHFEIKSYDWQGDIPASKLVIIENPYGSIRSRNNSERKIFLHATYQLIGDSALSPSFDIQQNEQYVKIRVSYADAVRTPQGQLRGRTDVAVLFPDDVSIYAKTDQGLIKIDKSASHVEAVSNSGDIQIDSRGLFKIATQTGKVKLMLRGQKMLGQSSVSSVSGLVTAEIFDDMSIALDAQSEGQVSLNGKHFSGKVSLHQGKSESLIQIISKTGDISVQIVKPPALVHSVVPSNASSVDIDLREVKKSQSWKPGDPIYDRDDKKIH